MSASEKTARSILEGLIDRLHQGGRLRVWSLVVTVFGDAVVPRGGRVALAALQEVMARLRIEPGALRTAMSRLAADQWVEREKVGRNSYFSLDAHGRHAFDLATRRIYAAGPPAWDGTWTVVIAPPGSNGEASGELADLGFVRINGSVHLRPESADAPDAHEQLSGMLVVHGESAEHPETFRKLWPSEELAQAYRDIVSAYMPLLSTLRASQQFVPLDAMAARTLLIHDWRRIVLRDPGLPRALLPDDWPGEEARAVVRDIYARLVEPSEAWLDTAGMPGLIDPDAFASRLAGPAVATSAS